MSTKIVIDTNIIIAALQSKHGASNKLLQLVDCNKFVPVVSVPLLFEYEAVIKRLFPNMPVKVVDALLDYLCQVSVRTEIYYLWRPILPDPQDDMVLELAVAAKAQYIISFNLKDFKGVEKFNISVLTPKNYLTLIGELS